MTLIKLLRKLGFRINWKKVEDPSYNITFLGITINSQTGYIHLKQSKVEEICKSLKINLHKTRISKAELQTIAGQLNWACNVIPWGRAHMAPFYQCLRTLSRASHKMRPTAALLEETDWWLVCLSHSRLCKQLWDVRPGATIATDASTVGAGAFCETLNSCLQYNWLLDMPHLANSHINIKELSIIQQAVRVWAPLLRGHHINILTDNSTSAFLVNKLYSRHPVASQLLKYIATDALAYDVTISCQHIPGESNIIPDALSRLHQPGQWCRFALAMLEEGCKETFIAMSPISQLFYSRWL